MTKQRVWTGKGTFAAKAIAAAMVFVFLLSSCSWAANQGVSDSELSLSISADDIRPIPREDSSDAKLFGNIPIVLSQTNSSEGINAQQDDREVTFETDVDRESALLLYYVEREVLVETGLEEVNVELLLDNYFERRFGSSFSENLEGDFDFEEFEAFFISLFLDFGIDLEAIEEGDEVEIELSPEQEEQLLILFFQALFEFIFQPFIAFFEFIESVFTNGVLLENRLASGAGAYQLFVRGGSIANEGSTVRFSLRNLRPGVEYVVIVGYYESLYDAILDDTEPNGSPEPPIVGFESFGFGSFILEEGVESRLRIRVDSAMATVEVNLNSFLELDEPGLNFASLNLVAPGFLLDFSDSFSEIEFAFPLNGE